MVACGSVIASMLYYPRAIPIPSVVPLNYCSYLAVLLLRLIDFFRSLSEAITVEVLLQTVTSSISSSLILASVDRRDLDIRMFATL